MPEETKAAVGVATLIAASGVASALAPDVEAWLNTVVGGGITIGVGGWLAWSSARWVWLEVSIRRECRQSYRDNQRAVDEQVRR